MVRGVALLVLAFLIVPAGFSKSPVKSKTNNGDKSTDDTTTTADATAAASNTIAAGTGAADTTAPAAPDAPVPPAQQPAGNTKAANDEYKPGPTFTPLLATTGTLGLFTTETADTLPKGQLWNHKPA